MWVVKVPPPGERTIFSIYLGLSNFCGEKKWDYVQATVKLMVYSAFYSSREIERDYDRRHSKYSEFRALPV